MIDESGSGEQRTGGGKNMKVQFDYEFLEDFSEKPDLFTRFMNRIKG